MIPIQPVLIVLVLCVVAFYYSRMRSKLTDRIIVCALSFFGIVLIASPKISTLLANALGVGRGVDLVIYISLVGLGFLQLTILSKIRSMEAQITTLTRELAIRMAEDGRLRRE